MSVRRPQGLEEMGAGLRVVGIVSEHPVVISSRRLSNADAGRKAGWCCVDAMCTPQVGRLSSGAVVCVWCVATAEDRCVASRRVGGGGPGEPGCLGFEVSQPSMSCCARRGRWPRNAGVVGGAVCRHPMFRTEAPWGNQGGGYGSARMRGPPDIWCWRRRGCPLLPAW